MEIKPEIAGFLYENGILNHKIQVTKDIRFPGEKETFCRSFEYLDYEKVRQIMKHKVGHIFVKLDYKLLKALNSYNSEIYRMPVKTAALEDFDDELKNIAYINKYSSNRRDLISCMEVYGESSEPFLHYNQKIDVNLWKTIKSKFKPDDKIAFRYSEFQIAILANLKPNDDSFYERFKLSTDVINALTQDLRSMKKLTNLASCSREKDIIIVDEPEMLFQIYQNGHIRLVIICGHHPAEEEREALIRIKKFDPYARFMIVPRYKEASFLMEVELNYIRDNWK